MKFAYKRFFWDYSTEFCLRKLKIRLTLKCSKIVFEVRNQSEYTITYNMFINSHGSRTISS